VEADDGVREASSGQSCAKRSIGPKTEAGKALSRMNACNHGLTAERIVIGDEDPNEFDSLRAELGEEHNPRSAVESELVERLAVLMWRMRRVPIFEAALIEFRRSGLIGNKDTTESLARALIHDSGDMLRKCLRYEAALMNAFNRALQQLVFLQDRRARDEDENRVVEILPSPAN
jgi:hypothetical protein